MTDTKKTIEQWERKTGVLFTDPKTDLKEKLTQDELNARLVDAQKYPTHSVDWEAREEWLKYNNYDVTRENMVANLSTVTTPPELQIEDAPSKKSKK